MAKEIYSFKQWCEDNDHQDWLELWDYEKNGKSPNEVAARSNKKYWFLCARGLHESEAKDARNMFTGRTHPFCYKCNSLGQWMLDHHGEDAISKFQSKQDGNDWFDIAPRCSRKVLARCPNPSHPDYLVTANRLASGAKCPVCVNRKIIPGVNDVATTHPQYAQYFKVLGDATKYSVRSGRKAWFKCPLCGAEKHTTVDQAFSLGHYVCGFCGDGVSFSNKFVQHFLKQLQKKNDIVFSSEKIFDWSRRVSDNKSKRVYDFYVEVPQEIIIEVHGMQHYERDMGHSRTLQDEKDNDLLKYDLAIKHDILPRNYIVLDCRYSEKGHIKTSIMESALPSLLSFTSEDIDWDACADFATSNLVRMATDLWLSGSCSVAEIGVQIGRAPVTVNQYLHKAESLGWLVYETNTNKPVLCVENGLAFVNCKVCSQMSDVLLGVHIPYKCVSAAARKESRRSHGYQFNYLTKAEFQLIKEAEPHRAFE